MKDLRFLLRHAVLIVCAGAACGLLGLVYGILLRPMYESFFSLLGPESRGGLFIKSTTDETWLQDTPQSLYVALLKSDSLCLEWIKANDLMTDDTFWGSSTRSGRTRAAALAQCRACIRIAEHSSLSTEPTRVTIRTRSASLSKKLADSLLSVLTARIHQELQSKRLFYTKRRESLMGKITESEAALRDFSEQRGLFISPELQAATEFDSYMDLAIKTANINAEAQAIQAERSTGGTVDKQVSLMGQESAWKAKLPAIERERERLLERLLMSAKDQETYRRLRRELAANEHHAELLWEQELMAVLRDESLLSLRPFRVIDRPYEADEPARRYLLYRALAGGLVGLLVGLTLCYCRELRWRLSEPPPP